MAKVVLTNHVKYRLLERGIDTHEAIRIAKNGKITKVNTDGSIKREGICGNGRKIYIVIDRRRNDIIVITGYYD